MVEAFALFCGLAIHNTQMYEAICKASAKQKVALECLSYHARASDIEVESFQKQVIPPADFYNLTRYAIHLANLIYLFFRNYELLKVKIFVYLVCNAATVSAIFQWKIATPAKP